MRLHVDRCSCPPCPLLASSGAFGHRAPRRATSGKSTAVAFPCPREGGILAAHYLSYVQTMKIVFASHSYFSSVFVVGSHHLARAAARANHQVWHISSALSIAHLPFAASDDDFRNRARLACSRGRVIEPHLHESVPLTLLPWPLLRRLRRPEDWYLTSFRSARRLAGRLGFSAPDLLLIDEPRLAGLAAKLRAKTVIYRPTDIYSQLKEDPSLDEVERRLLAKVHGVVGTSGRVLEHVESLRPGLPSLLLENGVDLEFLQTPQPEPLRLRSIPHPRAIYVGALDPRFDHGLLRYAAQQNPNLSFVIIGGDAEGPCPNNVHYLGRQPYADMPAYLQHCELGVMPMSTIAANQGRSPMKLFEFGAAGLPVVATSTAELARRALPFVHLAAGPEQFASACARAVDADEAERAQARHHAAQHGWGAKSEQLLEFARSLAPEQQRMPAA